MRTTLKTDDYTIIGEDVNGYCVVVSILEKPGLNKVSIPKKIEDLTDEDLILAAKKLDKKTFETPHGIFILAGDELTLFGTNKTIKIEDPDNLTDDRLEKIYNVIYNPEVEKDSVDELGKIAYGLEAIVPQSF